MHSDWFNGTEILQGRWQHGEKVRYCYPSGLEKTLCKWDIYVPLVTKGLKCVTYSMCRGSVVDAVSRDLSVYTERERERGGGGPETYILQMKIMLQWDNIISL
jgi:hypothetical protein